MILPKIPQRYKTIEHKIQSAIIKYLLLNKWIVIRFNSGAQKTEKSYIRFYIIENLKASKGISDLFICKGNLFAFIECKKDDKQELSESQKTFFNLLEHYNVKHYKVSTLDEIIKITKELECTF